MLKQVQHDILLTLALQNTKVLLIFSMNQKNTPMNDRENFLYGRHPVSEAVKSGTSIDRLVLRLGAGGSIIGEIISAAKERGIRIDRLPPEVFDKKFPMKANGGVVVYLAAVKTIEFSELLKTALNSEGSSLLVMLDGIEDPHNVGAIARSVEGAGGSGIIIPRRRSAPLSMTAVKSSAGALLHLPICRTTNLSVAIKDLKDAGFWIYGADMSGRNYLEVEFNEPVVLVIGAEGKGISKLVKKHCDELISIPLKGKIDSLNASVSAGVLLFHLASLKSPI